MKETKKMKKRIIALMLAIVTVFSVFAMTTVSAYAALSNQVSYPLKEYPNGSYYTTTGKDCTSSHKSCKSYANGKQCFAFAKYAYDQASHRSSWSSVSGDIDTKVKPFNNDKNTAEKVMKGIPIGAYVRVTGNSGYSSHSFILLSVSSTGITVYDANYTGYCKVDTHSFTFEQLKTRYSGVSEVMSHDFSKKLNYNNATYHKVACSRSGCTGYSALETHTFTYTKFNATYHTKQCSKCGYGVKQVHFADSPGTKATCAGCGYVGNISEGRMSVGDETASVNYDFDS